MKKRIFISVHSMGIGGVETSLIGLLQSFDYAKVDVDVFVFAHQGEFLKFIPCETRLLPENAAYRLALSNWKSSFKAGYFRLATAQFIAKVRMWLYVHVNRPKTFDALYSYMGACLNPVLPDIGVGEYDLALSFLDPHNFVLRHVKAKKKFGWIHSDYTTIDVNQALEAPVWESLDKVVGVSEDVCTQFAKVFPAVRNRLVTIENILSPKFVRARAEEFSPEEYQGLKGAGAFILCSMGRICYQKNFDNIPYMALKLRKLGVRFRWFVIGPGDSEAIVAKAQELGVADCIFFIGARSNPYPYLKGCDLYVQPSNFEGKSVAVREAQILCKPVLITDYPTASSQVQNGQDGVIVHLDNHEIAVGIANLLNDRQKMKSIVEYLALHDYGNEHEVEKLYQMMD